MENKLDEFSEKVADFIVRPESGSFDSLALELFEFQFANTPPYRNYCRGLGRTPDTVSRPDEIPAVPTQAFKDFSLTCLPEGQSPEAVFHTSGTTLGTDRPGRHIVPRLSLYHAAIRSNFKTHLLPDRPRLSMFILAAPPSLWKHSSLSHMMEVVRTEFGDSAASYYFGPEGLESGRLIRDLEAAAAAGKPVLLLGITLAFCRLMEELDTRGLSFSLSPGSRVMDTGGFKGQRAEISRSDLLRQYRKAFGISEEYIVNEYGMTEMCSQFYDSPIANRGKANSGPRHKTTPHWVRTRILDPGSLESVPSGTTGILQHLDLANAGSVMAVLTEDLGYGLGNGFELAGRIQGAEARGCSLLIEELRRS